ncbi:MAG TPA: DNA mismatch endonuclease Vsr [Thermoanaerobaculia bacterium]|nr:DNA mismatch endonuclease Vsr [Thermoanaerobaculia bacterium]
MVDVLSPAQRRKNMQRIRSKDTKPELRIRQLVHSLGYRFRLHRRVLPGSPDLVFASRQKVIFVHGCYWHMHSCRFGRVVPATNAKFWQEKRDGNKKRDERKHRALRSLGWSILVVWECQLKDGKLTDRIRRFLDGHS